MISCKFKKIPCPNKPYGCPKLLLKSQWNEHLERECQFIPVQHLQSSQDAIVTLCQPIPMSDVTDLEPSILGFGALVEANTAAALLDT